MPDEPEILQRYRDWRGPLDHGEHRLFSAYYRPPQGGMYGTDIYARSGREAYTYMIIRGLGEIFSTGYDPDDPENVGREVAHSNHRLFQLMMDDDLVKAGHEVTFLSYVGLCAGVLTPHETFGDRGFAHELYHMHEYLSLNDEHHKGLYQQLKADLLPRMAEAERAVPGWTPTIPLESDL